ncbi:hypothetical protein [Cryobacterium sp. N22]|uniref:hypothetical protein n=1 Tax=Cryobacterium sp. N22 TaxID=2048290 RepID=UPI0011B072A8|nr:hypothetical protein [Cryobacterium sp. N22]
MAQNVYDDPYDLALADPQFRAAAAAAHTGRWSLLDALWWEWHPEDPAPSGSPSPIHRLRELQRRVFAADGDAAGDHAVAQVVRELEAEIVAERSAATEAITAAHADLRRRTAAQTGVGGALAGADDRGGPGDTPEPDGPGEADDGPAADAPRPAAPRRRVLLIAGLAAAVLLGVIVGGPLSALTGLGAAPAPTASATAAGTPQPLALSAFQREQTPEDLPAILLPEGFDVATLRQLGSMGSVDAGPAPQIVYYVARTTSNMVCLIVVPLTMDYLSTCTLEQDFPSTGLRLYWASEGIFSSPDDGSAMGPTNTYLTWRPDGSVEVGSVG